MYIDKNKWPDNHILLDDHVKYAFRYSMIDNSYFPLKQTGKTSGEFDYVIIKENITGVFNMSKLYFKFGAMASSKTANALMTRFNYEEKGNHVWLVKPHIAGLSSFIF